MTATEKLTAHHNLVMAKREEIKKQYGNSLQGLMKMIKDAKALASTDTAQYITSQEDALMVLSNHAARTAH